MKAVLDVRDARGTVVKGLVDVHVMTRGTTTKQLFGRSGRLR